jgi:hypothetical protein
VRSSSSFCQSRSSIDRSLHLSNVDCQSSPASSIFSSSAKKSTLSFIKSSLASSTLSTDSS